MSTNENHVADEALINLVRALAIEVTTHGSDEADLIMSGKLSDQDADTLMKANTFLSAFSSVLIQIVERQNPGFARLVMDVWTSDPIQTLVSLAFADEIQQATDRVQESILDLEREINKEE
jgi:hypothetical protein